MTNCGVVVLDFIDLRPGIWYLDGSTEVQVRAQVGKFEGKWDRILSI